MWLIRAAAPALILAYAAFLTYVTFTQRSMLFRPDTEHVDPKAAGLTGVVEELVETPDGAKLVTWWTPPEPGRPVIVYFHGNGGNISYRAARVAYFQRHGCGVLMVEYRGYGGSTGTPSEHALKADARLMLDRLAAKGYPSDRLILFGESLGSGIAVELASQRPVAALILDSPYTALVDVAAERLPLIPVRLLMWDRFLSLPKIASVHAPLLIIHGDADDVVPFAMGERMFAAANDPKSFVRLRGASHVTPLNDLSKSAIEKLLRSIPAIPR